MASLPDADGHSCARPDAGGDCFFISRFASDEPYMAGVSAMMDEEALVDYVAANPTTCFDSCIELPALMSTRRVTYDVAFKTMTARLRKTGGKVVLSRHESIYAPGRLIDTVERYFSASPGSFRYLCFTPENGVWFGATPELLLETTHGSGELHTMALAGTRPAGSSSDEEWDDKNLTEHELVVNFIVNILASHGLEVSAAPISELNTGAVTHLCTGITARGDVKSAGAIINELNPTPAVAGWPREVAIAEIDALETHLRRCYSGIVGVKTDGALHVYVNLRCAFTAPVILDNVAGWVYNLYAGGGLMPESKLDEEWDETARKMQVLRNCLRNPISNPIDAIF